MPLSTAMLTRLARDGERMFGGILETITVHAKATAQAPVIDYVNISGRFGRYNEQIIAMHQVAGERPQVLRDDEELRIATDRVTWTPTTHMTLTRTDGTTWRVMSFMQGVGSPWYKFQVRKVPNA